jgi:MEDS: MEthanogen/methylotroph, DcmR Sensory domain
MHRDGAQRVRDHLDHAVQFYGSEPSLIATVSDFIAPALAAGEPGIVIATGTHRPAILRELSARQIDCERAVDSGQLLLLDAVRTLETFMVGEEPDPARFDDHVGEVVAKLLRERPAAALRAYGEMVDVLWRAGRAEAAVKLEILWNKLARRHGFSLLCGYSMGSFYKQAGQRQRIVDQHTAVIGLPTDVETRAVG